MSPPPQAVRETAHTIGRVGTLIEIIVDFIADALLPSRRRKKRR